MDERRRSLLRETPLPMTGCRVLLTQRTMASSDAQMDLVAGSGTAWDEAMRADLLFEESAAVLAVAEPHGTQRPELVLEGGMNAVKMDMVVGAGAHFKKIGWVDEVSSSEAV